MNRASLRVGALVSAAFVIALSACQVDRFEERTCSYGGQTYVAGEGFAASDGCNSCRCGSDGAVSCTLIGCVSGCSYSGNIIPVGAVVSNDGCNTCTCGGNGSIACTERACFDGGADSGRSDASDAGTCGYAGKTYADGASFPATDGCNTCTCSSGAVGCTKKACMDGGFTCPPDGVIDCMPVVPVERAPLCSGPQHDLIVQNCPRVTFVY